MRSNNTWGNSKDGELPTFELSIYFMVVRGKALCILVKSNVGFPMNQIATVSRVHLSNASAFACGFPSNLASP